MVIGSDFWNLSSGYSTMPSGQGQNMSFLAILKLNWANYLLVLEIKLESGKKFLLLTRYHYWLDNITEYSGIKSPTNFGIHNLVFNHKLLSPSEPHPLTFYLTYILTVYLAFYLRCYLTCFLTVYLAFYLTIYLTFYLAYILTFYLAFYLIFYATSCTHNWGPAVPTWIWLSQLKSGSAHWALALDVDPRGWGPAALTEIWSSRLKSGSSNWDLELAFEVWKCLLRSGARGWGAAAPIEVWQCPLRSGARGWRPAVLAVGTGAEEVGVEVGGGGQNLW